MNVVRDPAGSVRLWPWILAAAILHVLPFAMRASLIGGDEPHFALAAHSMAMDADVDLENDYVAVRDGSLAAGRKQAGRALEPHLVDYHGRRVFSHPVGLPALVTPEVRLLEAIRPGGAPDVLLIGTTLVVTFVAFLAGLTLLQGATGESRSAVRIAFAVYFATPIWYYSRTFFTEPYTWAFFVLAVWAVARDRWVLASVLLGLVFLMKETGILLIVPVLVYVVLHRGLRRAALLAVGPLAAVVVFVVKNLAVYGAPLVTYQAFRLGSFLDGAAGVAFDPRHGLIPFAPLTIVAMVGFLRPGPRSKIRSLLPYAAFVVTAFFLIVSAWIDWRGGSCYGPRLMVPAIPLLAVPLILVDRLRSRVFRFAAGACIVCGFAIQCAAATNPFFAMWSPSIAEILARNPLGAGAGAVLSIGALVLLRDLRSDEVLRADTRSARSR